MEVFNNKGQSIVIFVLFLPIIILIIAYVYDVSMMSYEKNKINNIAEIAKDNFDSNVCNLVHRNDKEILCVINNNKLTLKKEIKSIFGTIIGNKIYKISITIES